MKYFFFLTLLTLFFPLTYGQSPEPPPEVPRFTFRALALGYNNSPELYWMDVVFDSENRPRNVYRLLEIGRGMRGASTEIPVRPEPRLYRRSIGENRERTYTPAMDLSGQSEDDHLLLVLYLTTSGDGNILLLDDSSEAHPAGTVRVLNLIPTNLAVNIGGGPRVVRHRNTRLLGAPEIHESGRFYFSYGFNVPDMGPWVSPTQRLRFRGEEERLLVVYATFPTYQDKEDEMNEAYELERGAELAGELELEGDYELEDNFSEEIEGDNSMPEIILLPELRRIYDRAPATEEEEEEDS
jgi:hypothetical protein